MDVVEHRNTSGQGPASQVPPEIRGWNWGAFLLSWIWGIGNNVLLALLVFVPFFGLFWWFVVGARGSEWAWRNKRWDSVAQFQATQRKWARWGAVLLLAWVGVVVLFVLGVFGLMKDSDAYRLARARLDADPRVAALVGQPFSTGLPSGAIRTVGPNGEAQLAFSIEGPRGKGQVFAEATRRLGEWRLDRLVFEEDGSHRRVDLSPEPAPGEPAPAREGAV